MTDVIDVLRALRTTLRGVQGLNVSLGITGQINPVHAAVGVPSIPDYRQAFAGARMLIQPTITLFTSAAFDEIGTLRMAEYISPSGPKSIFAAIEEDKTLGGLVEQCRVTSFDTLSPDEIGSIGYFGGTFFVDIMARG